MPVNATLHLISGLPCAGKTMYAERLQDESGAVPLSLDHWLISAFGRYPVDAVGHDEHLRRVYACRELIREVAAEFLRRGVDVILDDGFFLRRDRQHHITLARELGAGAVVHFVDTPIEVLRQRVAARNREPGDFRFEIASNVLDAYIQFFEPPSADEGCELVVVRDAGSHLRPPL
jgi:predicted kinase